MYDLDDDLPTHHTVRDPQIARDAQEIAEAVHVLRNTSLPLRVSAVHRLASQNDLSFAALNCARAYLGTIHWQQEEHTGTWWWVLGTSANALTLDDDTLDF